MIGWARRDLGALDPLDSDAFTRCYVVGYRLPGLPAPLTYREIRPDHELPAGVSAADVRDALVQAVAIRDRCSAADRAELDTRTDWSLAIVAEQDVVVGVLLPGLPDDFLLPSGPVPGTALGHARRALTLRDLCASDEAAAANGIERGAVDDDLVRLALAAQLARTIHLLHRNRMAYSDLTLDRVAIAGRPPRTVLIGCDPTVPLSGPRTEFASPAGSAGPAIHGDPARLALCVIRALAKGPGATQLTDPARVGALLGEPGVGLLARALAPPPAQRPSAQQIYRYLTGRLAELARESGLAHRAVSLPRLDVAAQLRGALPRPAVPNLPAVAAPPAAALPQRPVVSSDAHPPPRIELPPVDLGLPAIDPAATGTAELTGVMTRAYVDANRRIATVLDEGLRTLRASIDERLLGSSRETAADRIGHRHHRGSTA